jgi:AbiV
VDSLRFFDRAPERTVLISLFCVGPHQPPLCPWPGTVRSCFEPLHQRRDAARLLNDARLPADHSRLASAFALAVLAVEEIGKALLDRQARIRARTSGTRCCKIEAA